MNTDKFGALWAPIFLSISLLCALNVFGILSASGLQKLRIESDKISQSFVKNGRLSELEALKNIAEKGNSYAAIYLISYYESQGSLRIRDESILNFSRRYSGAVLRNYLEDNQRYFVEKSDGSLYSSSSTLTIDERKGLKECYIKLNSERSKTFSIYFDTFSKSKC